jgi:hypothetical protein
MAEPGKPGAPAPTPAEGPSRQQLEERWKDVVEALTERPRDVNLCIQAGDLSQQLDRRPEAWNYYHKAVTLDPSKTFLIAKLRGLAATQQQKDDVTRMSQRPASFAAGLSTVFKYPLKGKGLPILLLGALFMWIGRGLASHGIGTAGLTIAGFIAAYMAMFYIDVCHTTVSGDDELPEWPDPLRLHEFGLDVGKFLVAFIVSFLPVILIFVFATSSLFSASDEELAEMANTPIAATTAEPQDEDDDDPAPAPAPAPAPPMTTPKPKPEVSPLAGTLILCGLGILVFGLVGLIYLPMATLVNVVMGSPFTCFNFPFVFRSIGSAAKDYMICLGAYFVTWLVMGAAEAGVRAANIILFTGLGLAFLELYAMTVLMRMLGLFYRMNQARLGWMAD